MGDKDQLCSIPLYKMADGDIIDLRELYYVSKARVDSDGEYVFHYYFKCKSSWYDTGGREIIKEREELVRAWNSAIRR